ncbi:hypothetical protein [Croceicoccus naphthovorans]|uniref:hypothetical protein n=1 Tax=Croceicoccus naphthovorans TaxID=1348774 RepID=UPI000AEE90EC|nr:hypothetical protein [Croceicoccus naphthovorans]
MAAIGDVGRVDRHKTLVPALSGASFAEVALAEPAATAAVSSPPGSAPNGRIGIELPSGVKLTVDQTVDADALARVLGVLAR